MEKEGVGGEPLQLVIDIYGASVEVIQLLVKEYPDAVKEKDGDGDLPLHRAVRKSGTVEVSERVVKE